MVLNFDDTENEPTVLPAGFPNLLVNGATGIFSGYATEIPPHNLGEVLDASIYLVKHPAADLADLMQFVKGPDFPTGGIIMGTEGIQQPMKLAAVVFRSSCQNQHSRNSRAPAGDRDYWDSFCR